MPPPPAQAFAARGAGFLHAAGRPRLLAFAHARRSAAGGFLDRAGREDPYYALFGFGVFSALDPASAAPLVRADVDLAPGGAAGAEDFIHTAARIRLRALAGHPADAALLARLEHHRTADGGYHVGPPGQAAGQVYAAYVALLAYEAAGAAWSGADAARATLAACRARGGGYGNEPGAAAGTVPATAAALIVLAHGDKADAAARRWLEARHDGTGGFRAGPAAPAADLLSTAVALYALRITGPLSDSLCLVAPAFVERCWNADGGFGAFPGDAVSDIEYSWYALLALGCALA